MCANDSKRGHEADYECGFNVFHIIFYELVWFASDFIELLCNIVFYMVIIIIIFNIIIIIIIVIIITIIIIIILEVEPHFQMSVLY